MTSWQQEVEVGALLCSLDGDVRHGAGGCLTVLDGMSSSKGGPCIGARAPYRFSLVQSRKLQ